MYKKLFGILLPIIVSTNLKCVDDKDLLHDAVRSGDVELVKQLLSTGININAFKKYGTTSLLLAIEKQNKEMVHMLVELGADVNLMPHCDIPLHEAIIWGDKEVVKMLIDKGADINKSDKSGHTPLHFAVIYRKQEIISLLIKHGANQDSITYTLCSLPRLPVLHEAVSRNYKTEVKSLIDCFANVDFKDNMGNSALHVAAKDNLLEIAKLLVDSGANKSIKNNGFQAALDIAKKPDMKELLICSMAIRLR